MWGIRLGSIGGVIVIASNSHGRGHVLCHRKIFKQVFVLMIVAIEVIVNC